MSDVKSLQKSVQPKLEASMARLICEVHNLSKPWHSSENRRGDISLSANHRWSNLQWLLACRPLFLSRILMLIGLVLSFVFVGEESPPLFGVLSIVPTQSPVLELIFTHCLRASPPL